MNLARARGGGWSRAAQNSLFSACAGDHLAPPGPRVTFIPCGSSIYKRMFLWMRDTWTKIQEHFRVLVELNIK